MCKLFGENRVLSMMRPFRQKYEWFIQVIFQILDCIQYNMISRHLTDLVWDYVGWTDSMNEQFKKYKLNTDLRLQDYLKLFL